MLPIPHDVTARADQLEHLRAVAATLAHRSGAKTSTRQQVARLSPPPTFARGTG